MKLWDMDKQEYTTIEKAREEYENSYKYYDAEMGFDGFIYNFFLWVDDNFNPNPIN